MIHFSLSDVRNIADSSTFSRGYDCNEASLSTIKSVSMLSDEIMQILSTTKGSKLYKQTINIYDHNDGVKIIGKCSCEVGRNCKHVVSSVLAYLDEESKESEPPLPAVDKRDEKETWLRRLQSSFIEKEDREFLTSSILLYELHPGKNGKEIEISVYTARQLKNGGYGKVNRARAKSLFNPYKVPDYLREEDKEAIQLLKVLCERVKTTAVLKGKLGALVLEGALTTHRCFWQRGHKKALEFSHSRELELVWKEEGAYASLALELGEKSYFIGTAPAYYVDTKTKSVGRIETELREEQLALLSSAPKLRSEELEAFVLEMSSALPQLHIQAPARLELKSLEDAQITPCLHLLESKGEYRVRMGFKYDGFYLNAFPQHSSHLLAGEKMKIERDPEKENHYIEEIKAYGFELKAEMFRAKELHAWRSFLEDEGSLKSKGFEISKALDFKLSFEAVDRVEVKVEQTSHWFDVGMHIRLENKELALLPILSKLLSEGIDLSKEEEVYFELEEGAYVSLPSKILKPILKTFYELLDRPNSEGFKLHRFEAQSMQNFEGENFCIEDKTELKSLFEEMKSKPVLKTKPQGLKASLRGYQQEGVAWMQFLRKYGFGGILADDMGLGKTIQTLAHLQLEKEQGRLKRPTLIVAPTSLLANWKKEAGKFTPDLRVALYYGNERRSILDNINKYDLLVTSYTILALESDLLKKEKFYYLILDEAQRIKNSRSVSAQASRVIQAQYFLALSGTPMENHLGELHSIFETVMPGFLGSLKTFKSLYQTPIEKEHNRECQEKLNQRIKPFMLRRTKDKVAKELPLKTEILRSVGFEAEQARLYETIRVSMEKKVRETIKSMGLGKSHISILDALLKLRQVCCDPRLLKIEEAQKIQESAKLQMLMELVEELREEKRRILIFSQFTSMLEIIEEQMINKEISYSKLTGSTLKREEQIEKFNTGVTEVFLISLKAGGVGLNLTKADVVIHYDPWWNPAAQDQATDRAYRIGQDKPVFVYKLIIENSVEEKIVKMQEEKRALAEAIYEGKEQGFSTMEEKELLELFK